ncbi:MAG TPA: long-chain fatty acid--CoA ligase [Candidatus Acidoferrales bacterium]|nr:long-chain fatty acid--CoA ligase [Candidatus Acidoferrales bacterium]
MPNEYPTLTACFLDAIDKHANPRAQMYRTESGWQSIAAPEMLRRVAVLARALRGLGIKLGDRVGLFAPNCPEWHTADFAILGIGAINVPVYFNESPDRLAYILNHAGTRVVITAGASQAQKLAGVRGGIQCVERVISAASLPDTREGTIRFETLLATPAADANAAVAEYRQSAMQVTPGQLATIIYTSGTTGEPKGVMLSHSNLSSNVRDSITGQEFTPSDVALEFLPLAHVYERIAGYGYLFNGVSAAYVDRMEDVPQALLEVHPTRAAAVPRFYEKIYAKILDQGHHEPAWKRKVFDWALRVAQDAVPWRAHGKDVPPAVKAQWRIANTLVYKKIRAGLGAQHQRLSSGGGPLAKELAEFFWSVGVEVYQGYGLTETSPVVSTNTPKANKVGTVGRPIPNVQVKIAEDGEILVKGPCVMQGYYKKPDDTRATISEDGWLRTGDIGKLDEDGYLIITDRKKELLKTAAGKFVAPALIENLLKTSPFISNAITVGDRQKFVSVLIVPNFAALEAEAGKEGREFPNAGKLLADSWTRDVITREVERLTERLAQYEKPKRFALIEQDFTFGNGQLTYTLKLKRRVIEQTYADVIERLYADVEEPKPQASGK